MAMQRNSHTFFMPRLGGGGKSAPFFCDFAVLSVKKRRKKGGSDVALRAKKCAFFGSQRGPKIRRLGGVLTVNFVVWGVKS